MSRFLLLFFFTVAVVYGNSVSKKPAASVSGRIVDQDNNPLPYVNCFLQNKPFGAMSDSNGVFTFTVNETGTFIFTAMSMGFKTYNRSLTIQKGSGINLEIQLESEILTVDAVNVSGNRIPDGEKHAVSLSKMQIFMTPGGAADVFQSLKSHIGITQVAESAELYVRGGDPTETSTILDQGILSHPYTFESPYGGLFSMLNTALLKNADFSPGGFSAKYGNALSGILVLETEDNPAQREFTVGLALSGLSCNGKIPIGTSAAGLRFAARKTMTSTLSSFNGRKESFVLPPQAQDITTSICYRYRPGGKFKATLGYNSDQQGVPVQLPQYQGIFFGNSNNTLLNIQHQYVLDNNTLVQSAFSFSSYKQDWQLGVLDLLQTDNIATFRTDLNTEASNSLLVRYGFEYYRSRNHFDGRVPKYDYDMRPGTESITIDHRVVTTRYGGYGEAEMKLNTFYAVLGVRGDYMPNSTGFWYDPRISLGYHLNAAGYMQINCGIFQQAPTGWRKNGSPMKAFHTTFLYSSKPFKYIHCNVSLYHKQYSNLPLVDSNNDQSGSGQGFASGIDNEIKFQNETFTAGLVYGYLKSKRSWNTSAQLLPSSYDITHSLTMVSLMNLSNSWQIGLSFKTATGRPFTPITHADYDTSRSIFIPRYDHPNSQRLPSYTRLDFRLLYLRMLFGNVFTVFFLEALNVLNIANTMDYAYSADYSERRDIRSFFSRRTIVFGTNITF